MSSIAIGTNIVGMDEPCYGISEVNLVKPPFHKWHRFQTIAVIRNDKIVEFLHDLGPSKKFKAEQFTIPNGMVENGKIWTTGYTVGQMITMAEKLRAKDEKKIEPRTDLIGEHYKLQEIKNKVRRHGDYSHFGYRPQSS